MSRFNQSNGFTPKKSVPQTVEVKQTSQPKSNQITTPHNPVTKQLRHQEELLNRLDATMNQISDDFCDRAVEIIETGIQSSYDKLNQRINAIELPFFEWVEKPASGSFFGRSQNQIQPTVEIQALPQSEVIQ